MAWVITDLILRANTVSRETDVPMRSTSVLEHRRNRWVILESYASLATGQKEGETFAEQALQGNMRRLKATRLLAGVMIYEIREFLIQVKARGQ